MLVNCMFPENYIYLESISTKITDIHHFIWVNEHHVYRLLSAIRCLVAAILPGSPAMMSMFVWVGKGLLRINKGTQNGYG